MLGQAFFLPRASLSFILPPTRPPCAPWELYPWGSQARALVFLLESGHSVSIGIGWIHDEPSCFGSLLVLLGGFQPLAQCRRCSFSSQQQASRLACCYRGKPFPKQARSGTEERWAHGQCKGHRRRFVHAAPARARTTKGNTSSRQATLAADAFRAGPRRGVKGGACITPCLLTQGQEPFGWGGGGLGSALSDLIGFIGVELGRAPEAMI